MNKNSSKHFPGPLTRRFAPVVGTLFLAACAMAPSKDNAQPEAEPVPTGSGPVDVVAAFDHFQRRDYVNAAAGYELAADGTRQEQRLSHLGQALIHLSTDPRWRDLEAAAQHLQAAEELAEGAGVETSMLITAMAGLVGVEKNISELNVKLANATAESARLKEEREMLLAEQSALNEAIEKLKALTIGN
ncbi:MAG: hypothetical protein HKN58_01225 [Xanthomonadales bacterium]|nr:hypothetical protein [Xanthomonadales bacterium]